MTNEGPPKTYGRTMVDTEETSQSESTEVTSLLSAGAEQQADGSENSNDGTINRGWEGFADFEGMPWWKTPTVRLRSTNMLLS